jgi:tetratricopeptide (TPR) repeat protein
VAQELGVRYVLEGSVRKAGPRVRVTGRLIDGTDGGHVWGDRYDRELTDIFAIQDEITHSIVDQLKVKLLPQERKAINAHYFYARTCYSQGKLKQAAHHYERAAEIKPDDYQSVVLLTQVYHSLGRLEDERESARRGVERAQRELARNPENPRPAYLGANALAVLGEVERAKEWASRALTIDPDDLLTRYNIACLCSYFGELDRALDLLEGLLPQANHETKAWVVQDSDFDPLHSHPRWQKVLELAR